MRTSLRKIGNSRGILIPAALLAQCGIRDEIELHLEGSRLIIEPVKPLRQGWFDHYNEAEDKAVLEDITLDEDSEEWEW